MSATPRLTRSSAKKIGQNVAENSRTLHSVREIRTKRIARVSSTEIKAETMSERNAKVVTDSEPKEIRLNITPRKQKLTVNVESKDVTPPKQKRTDAEETILSPSHLFNLLNLNSPTKSPIYPPTKLFDDSSLYQNARKALHSTVPSKMPSREKEHQELRLFIKNHICDDSSATLYISGPPGTGKTASLSVVLQEPDIASEIKEVYINCTSVKSSGSIYSKIVKELNIKCAGRSERDYLTAIESHLQKNRKMTLLVLDELDQLESKKQSVLYSIFEWPARFKTKLLLIGIANALDLTDRVLPRLQGRCELKPILMHFAPYTKQQIVDIFLNRLKEGGVLDVFSPVALQMLAGKVAAVSGDVRRALDIGRRVIELVERNEKHEMKIENLENKPPNGIKAVDLKQVVAVLNNVYGTSQNFSEESDNFFPLQQKIILCTLLLILRKARNKDVTLGKLHQVYRKICSKRNLMGVDQAEFVGLCSLIETRGIIRIGGRKEAKLQKVNLEWNEEEVGAALKDKQLMSSILEDVECLGKL